MRLVQWYVLRIAFYLLRNKLDSVVLRMMRINIFHRSFNLCINFNLLIIRISYAEPPSYNYYYHVFTVYLLETHNFIYLQHSEKLKSLTATQINILIHTLTILLVFYIILLYYKHHNTSTTIVTYNREKINDLIDFPLTGLNLSPYVLGPQSVTAPPVYDLYAGQQVEM